MPHTADSSTEEHGGIRATEHCRLWLLEILSADKPAEDKIMEIAQTADDPDGFFTAVYSAHPGTGVLTYGAVQAVERVRGWILTEADALNCMNTPLAMVERLLSIANDANTFLKAANQIY